VHKTIILQLVLYGTEPLTLTEEHRLRVFDTRVLRRISGSKRDEKGHGLKVFDNSFLRRISGPKSDEIKGEWRKLHSEELHNWYESQNII
jgi:hypothetical protein